MRLEEARDIEKMHEVPSSLRREAKRVIQLAESLGKAERSRVEIGTVSRQQLERVNSLLAYRLALACGKFDDWRQAA